MWIGEARTRIGPSHPDSLSLSLFLSPLLAAATGAATGETGVHSNQTKATCATLSPLFTPHQSALRRSYVIILRLMSTYTGLIDPMNVRSCLSSKLAKPIVNVIRSFDWLSWFHLKSRQKYIRIERVESLNFSICEKMKRKVLQLDRKGKLVRDFSSPIRFHNSEDTLFSPLSLETCSRRHPFFLFFSNVATVNNTAGFLLFQGIAPPPPPPPMSTTTTTTATKHRLHLQ